MQSKSSLPLSSSPTSIAAGMAGSVSVAAVFSGAVRHYLLTFSVLSCFCEADPDICTHVMIIFSSEISLLSQGLVPAASLSPTPPSCSLAPLQRLEGLCSPQLYCAGYHSIVISGVQYPASPLSSTLSLTHSGTRSRIPTSGSLLHYINQSCFVMAACTLVIMLIVI